MLLNVHGEAPWPDAYARFDAVAPYAHQNTDSAANTPRRNNTTAKIPRERLPENAFADTVGAGREDVPLAETIGEDSSGLLLMEIGRDGVALADNDGEGNNDDTTLTTGSGDKLGVRGAPVAANA
jgi:hypothetical protein